MSEHDNLPGPNGPLLDLPRVETTAASTIPTTEYVRPCERIEPETKEFEGMPTLADRFATLTHLLPLAGAPAMKSREGGELALTAHLRARAPWYSAAIDLLDQQWRLQLWLGKPWISFRPLLLVGPPGSGKSHLARMIAQRAQVGHSILSLAGVPDAMTMEGNPRGFTNTMPCFPALTIAQHGTANPIVVAEEVDKAGSSGRHGDPVSALLTLIEPSTARHYWDRCLLAPVNVSHVNWICTANSIEMLSAPLRSRLDIVHVDGPAPEHFDILLVNLLDEIAGQWQLPHALLPELAPEAEELLRHRFARHRSVRRLERELKAAMAAGISAAPRSIS